MLIRTSPDASPRDPRRERRLWNDEARHTPSLGCATCPQRDVCGGLSVSAPVFDCLAFCCGEPERCDMVCRHNPDFVRRAREVGGFALETVPTAPVLAGPALPHFVPVLFHRGSREAPLAAGAVAIPLSRMLDRHDGTPRVGTHEKLCTAFGIAPGTPIVLTGTDVDPPLERWWGLGEERRRTIIRALRGAGAVLATTPNYSVFIDVPRWDDLHAMKRIALVHREFLDEGLPAALHVNGRTDADFRRWAAYVTARPEVTHLAYEFATGAGRAGRQERHASWLAGIAAAAGRPLGLVVRGGVDVLPMLTEAFERVTILDTSVFMKTMMRRRAEPVRNARMAWRPSPTPAGAPLDGLLAHNLGTVGAWLRDLAAPPSSTRSAAA